MRQASILMAASGAHAWVTIKTPEIVVPFMGLYGEWKDAELANPNMLACGARMQVQP